MDEIGFSLIENHTLSTAVAPAITSPLILDVMAPQFICLLGGFLLEKLSDLTLWNILVIALLFANLKSLPFIWHLRIVNALRFCLPSQRPHVPVTPSHLFQPIITTSRAPLMEIDLNLHKTNSSYFSDVDVARTHLFCTLFSKGLEVRRGGVVCSSREPSFNIVLGAVSCSFKRELKPYEAYEMWSRILSWDEKWIYVITHFVRKDHREPCAYSLYPQQEGRRRSNAWTTKSFDSTKAICGTALSRCVFKQGRQTVGPKTMLELSGLLPMGKIEVVSDAMVSNDASCCWTADRIEEERCRGLAIARQLALQNQQDLEQEFSGESVALGRHTDGAGVIGVVSTLAQLAKLKRQQML